MHVPWGQLVPGDPFQMRKVLENRAGCSEQNTSRTQNVALTGSSPRVDLSPSSVTASPLLQAWQRWALGDSELPPAKKPLLFRWERG